MHLEFGTHVRTYTNEANGFRQFPWFVGIVYEPLFDGFLPLYFSADL